MSERPLSPHLQVYRLPFTAILSITHRFTGVALALGLVLWVVFLMAAAGGAESFATAQAVLDAWPGRLLLWAWLFALFFHLCHGVRHLVWDTVHGLDRETLTLHGIIELAAALMLTLATFGYSLLQA
jgi:succinate dehydrogenase / fumarate reductase cytochrome b subunit